MRSVADRPAPGRSRPPWRAFGAALRRRYFRSPLDGALTLLCIVLVIVAFTGALRWTVLDSVWDAKDAAQCVERGSGACWAVIHARIRLIIFGVYPYGEQWRAAIGCIVLLTATILTFVPSLWRLSRLAALWILSFGIFFGLMRGGLFGLAGVSDDYWGGLALTFLVFASMMLIGMPLAILLALARHAGPRGLRVATGLLIDLVRSLPLTAILFTAWLFFLVVLPHWISGDKLFRAILGFALFFACFEAEVLRGGLQAVGRGQEEAAKSLGIRFWQYQLTVILPQVFRISLPQTVNLIVAGFKDTSYIAILGFFDMVASASAAIGTADWAPDYVEVYIVVGLLYFIFAYTLSRYGRHLERRMSAGYQH